MIIALILVVIAFYVFYMRWDIRRVTRKTVQERRQRASEAHRADSRMRSAIHPDSAVDGVYSPLSQPTEAEIEMLVNSIDVEWANAEWVR